MFPSTLACSTLAGSLNSGRFHFGRFHSGRFLSNFGRFWRTCQFDPLWNCHFWPPVSCWTYKKYKKFIYLLLSSLVTNANFVEMDIFMVYSVWLSWSRIKCSDSTSNGSHGPFNYGNIGCQVSKRRIQNYRKVSSRNMCYFSENQLWWVLINQNMLTSVSNNLGQSTVLYHYCGLSQFFWNRRYYIPYFLK